MYEAIQTLHSYWAYFTLLALLVAALHACYGFFGRKEYVFHIHLRMYLFALIFSHLQLLIGLVLYFVSPRFGLWSEMGMGVMKNDMARLYLVEHPLINIIAIILITIGWSQHKKEELSRRKFGKIALFYTLGLVFVLSRIPWDAWFS